MTCFQISQMLSIVRRQIVTHQLVYQKYPHQRRGVEVAVTVDVVVKYCQSKIVNMIQKNIVVFG